MKLVAAWIDVHGNDWSGVPAGLARGLDGVGAYAGVVDGALRPALARTTRRWLSATGRLDEGWLLTPEMVALNRGVNGMRRLRGESSAAGYVQLGAFYGRPVTGPLATFEDRTPAQITWGTSAPPFSPGKYRRLLRLHARLYDAATACCVASSWAKRSLVEDFGVPVTKVHVVGFGHNVETAPNPARDWSTPRLLFVGRDWRRKNGDAVVDAFLRLRAVHPDARLDIVGGHPPLDVAGVTGHGVLDLRAAGDRLAQLFAQATAFVMPSHEEPFGIAYVEAMAAGLPVIATANGGPPDFVDDEVGFLVDPDDSRALSASMLAVSDAARAHQLGRAAQRRAEHYTWPAVAARVLAAIGLGLPAARRAPAGTSATGATT